MRAYRAAVDAALLAAIDDLPADLVELGLNHEQQHQELMLMDLHRHLRRKSAAPGGLGGRAAAARGAARADRAGSTGAEGIVEIGA